MEPELALAAWRQFILDAVYPRKIPLEKELHSEKCQSNNEPSFVYPLAVREVFLPRINGEHFLYKIAERETCEFSISFSNPPPPDHVDYAWFDWDYPALPFLDVFREFSRYYTLRNDKANLDDWPYLIEPLELLYMADSDKKLHVMILWVNRFSRCVYDASVEALLAYRAAEPAQQTIYHELGSSIDPGLLWIHYTKIMQEEMLHRLVRWAQHGRHFRWILNWHPEVVPGDEAWFSLPDEEIRRHDIFAPFAGEELTNRLYGRDGWLVRYAPQVSLEQRRLDLLDRRGLPIRRLAERDAMTSAEALIEKLLALGARRQDVEIDWAATEAQFGVTLPQDYKTIMNSVKRFSIRGEFEMLDPLMYDDDDPRSLWFQEGYYGIYDGDRPPLPEDGSFFHWAVSSSGCGLAWEVRGGKAIDQTLVVWGLDEALGLGTVALIAGMIDGTLPNPTYGKFDWDPESAPLYPDWQL